MSNKIINKIKNKIRDLLPETKENKIGRYSNYLLLGLSKKEAFIGLQKEGITLKDLDSDKFFEVYEAYTEGLVEEWKTL